MSNYRPPLPSAWINKIFSTMQGHYGSRFVNMWKTGDALPSGQDAGYVNAQRTWADKLSGFNDYPECIAYVLEGLPEHPPTLPEFVELCRRAPRKEKKLLEFRVSEEDHERNKERLRQLKEALSGNTKSS